MRCLSAAEHSFCIGSLIISQKLSEVTPSRKVIALPVVGIETSAIYVGHREFRTIGLHSVIGRGNATGSSKYKELCRQSCTDATQEVSCVDGTCRARRTERSWPKGEMPGGQFCQQLPPFLPLSLLSLSRLSCLLPTFSNTCTKSSRESNIAVYSSMC